MLYTLRVFSLQNVVCFIMLTRLVPVLFTFYIQDVLKLEKNHSGAKGLKEQFRNFVTLFISLIFCAINLYIYGVRSDAHERLYSLNPFKFIRKRFLQICLCLISQ